MESPILPQNATENITGMLSLFRYVSNDVLEGWFFVIALFSIFLIILIILKTSFDMPRSFTSASFLCMIFSIVLRTVGLITNTWMYLYIVLTAFGALWLYLEGR